MAKFVYKSGAQLVQKFEDIQADFPAEGIPVADTITIGIHNPTTNVVTVEYTMDSLDDITAGTAQWISKAIVSPGDDAFIVEEYGPAGVRFVTAGAGATGWIKS